MRGSLSTKATLVRDAVLALLEKTRLTEDELRFRLGKAADRDYWERLNPPLSVQSDCGSLETRSVDTKTLNELVAQLHLDGYFQTAPLLPASAIDAMADCVEVLRREGWPPVFAFVYDQFWAAVRSAPVVQLLSSALGNAYRQNSNVWCHYVPAASGVGGWPPHTDNFCLRNRVNVWVPLTDATTDNGCMYVIPRSRIPAALAQVDFKRFRGITLVELQALLQGSLALPARAGSVLGWDFQLIHWGSLSGGAASPRISLSAEFIGESADAVEYEHPLFQGHASLPILSERLHSIGKSILSYQRFEPLLLRYDELARRLVTMPTL